MSLSLLAQVALAAGPIVAFLEGTVVYALSQQWEDLLSTYLFRLHAVPNCGEHLVLACSPEASAPRQFRYVAGLLATSALVQASRLYLPYISTTSPLYLPRRARAALQLAARGDRALRGERRAVGARAQGLPVRCRGDAGEMQGRYRGDMREI